MSVTMLLQLKAPIQSWGTTSRFTRRSTDAAPSKSGVIGMIAAAMGRRRTDPIEDLLNVRFGARLDQPGSVLRDFQTAQTLDRTVSMPLSSRYYLTDAAFLVGVEGEEELVAAIIEAIISPQFPLYLGRRSCVPDGPLRPTMTYSPIREALTDAPWIARSSIRERANRLVELEVVVDANDEDADRHLVRDVPESFDPERRLYGFRAVARYMVIIDNPDSKILRVSEGGVEGHDPMMMETL